MAKEDYMTYKLKLEDGNWYWRNRKFLKPVVEEAIDQKTVKFSNTTEYIPRRLPYKSPHSKEH